MTSIYFPQPNCTKYRDIHNYPNVHMYADIPGMYAYTAHARIRSVATSRLTQLWYKIYIPAI